MGICKELNKNGKTICLTTHYLEEAENLCEFITIINNGKVIISDLKNNLIKLITNKTVTFEIEKIKKIPDELNIYDPKIKNNFLVLNYDKSKSSLSNIIKILDKYNINYTEVSTSEGDLEDVFVKLTSR